MKYLKRLVLLLSFLIVFPILASIVASLIFTSIVFGQMDDENTFCFPEMLKELIKEI